MKNQVRSPQFAIGALLCSLALLGPFVIDLPIFPAIVLGLVGLLAMTTPDTPVQKPEDTEAPPGEAPESLREEDTNRLRESSTDFEIVARDANYALIQVWSETLRSYGIPTEIRDEFIGSTFLQFSIAAGEIKLLVPKEFLSEATEILSDVPEQGDLDEPLLRCPSCGSPNIWFAGGMSPLMITALVTLNFAFPMKRKKHLCLECGTKWQAHNA